MGHVTNDLPLPSIKVALTTVSFMGKTSLASGPSQMSCPCPTSGSALMICFCPSIESALTGVA